MKIKNYKIIDDGIWIPKSELHRMIEDLYKAALGYEKARKEKKDCAYEAAMLRTQGGAEAYEYLCRQILEEEKKMKAPDRICLQVCRDCPQTDCENCEIEDNDEITCCRDRTFERDVEYIHKDAVIDLIESLGLIHRTQADVDATMKDVKEKAKAFTEAHRDESAEEILAAMRGEEPVSEEFKKVIEEYATKRLRDPELCLEYIYFELINAVKYGVNLQKEQMMKNAIDCYIRRNKCTKKNVLNGFDVTCDAIQKFNNGDKVKVIFVKEE